VEIANPIYDAVFKFLLEDKKAAMLIIGAITGFDITDIELRPTEVVLDERGLRPWTVYRLDLLAHVRTSEGVKAVLVEVQKAKFHTDIERFRRYLGSQYSSMANYEETMAPDSGVAHRRAMPLFTIYILGHRLEHNSDVPVIRVSRGYIDNTTGNNLPERDEFIESLTHDCAIIQVPALTGRRRDRLEKLLAVFDQALIRPDNHHLLNVAEDQWPEECQVLVRRLVRAVAEKEIRQRMDVEDDIVSEFEARDRREYALQEATEAAKAREQDERRQKEEARASEAEARASEAEARASEAEARAREKAALAEIEQLKRQLGRK